MELKVTLIALIIGFISSALIGPVLLPILRKFKFGQSIRKEGPKSHYVKAGTPTIGGLIFIFGTLISIGSLYLLGMIEFSSVTLILIITFLGFGAIGFLDDILIILKGKNDGLSATNKLIFQFTVALIFYIIYILNGGSTRLIIDTLNIDINLGWLYGVFILIYLVGFSNAVNLTDGLDGLAGGLSVIAFFAIGLIAWGATGVNGNEEIAVFAFALIGGLLGFLIYNLNPAKVFMGDTGSLALGAVLATMAILTRHEVTMIIIGGVFMFEMFSVIIQVTSYKLTKRRVFLMAPFHHHFEMLGWKETQIVRLFWGTGFVLALLAIAFGVWL